MIKMKADAFCASRKGSVLVWAVVDLLLLSILIGSVLTLSMAYYIRSVNNNNAKQAYYTARSAVDSIAGIFCDATSGQNRETLLSKLTAEGSNINLSDLKFNANPGMGSCSAVIKRESYNGSDTLLITATAVVGKQTKSVSLRLQNHTSEQSSPFDQLVIGTSTGSGSSGVTNYGFQTDSRTDLYIGSDLSEFDINITANGNSPQLLGNVYSKSPFYIKSDYYANTHVHGNIISDQLVSLSDNVTVGPYPGCCAGTQKESEVYTTSVFTAIDAAKIYSKVTAQSVALSDEVSAYNDISADTITIQDNVTVTGNITANRLVMSNQAKVMGNVTAGNLVLQNNALITGNVNAVNITINKGGKIDGTVTAKSVASSGNWQNPMITGDLTIESSVSSNIRVGGKITAGVPYTWSGTPFTPLVSKVPPAPGDPVLPSPSDHPATAYSNPDQMLGNTDGSDSYYTVNGNLNVTTMKTQGQGNIYIFVMSGATFTLNDMTPENKTNPHVFIIVESGGTFKRTNIEAEEWMDKSMYKDFYGYICGKSGSTIYIGRGTHIYGGISAKSAAYGIDVAVNYIPTNVLAGSSTGGSSGTSGTGGGTVQTSAWSALQYEP